MRISDVRTKPLSVPFKKPYHWAQGVVDAATVVLVQVSTDEGITGYGECIGTPSAEAVETHVRLAAGCCLGRSPFENSRLMREAYHALFQALGTCSAPRYGGLVLAGIEMALWDVMGKATGRAVHELLGGALHDAIGYFGFPQGESPEELANEAKAFAAAGCDVIYVKVGRGDALDLAIVAAVRAAIGPDRRLRVDPNEHWGPVTAACMIRKMAAFDVELVEQPTDSRSLSALAQVRASSPVAIAADQLVFTPADVFDVCRQRAADLIVLGLHETGGIAGFRQAAAIAEAAGLNVCVHGLFETGITTAAAHHAAATVANLDDGNQYMNHLLQWDIVAAPDLELKQGRLAILPGPGLGLSLDEAAVERAAECYQRGEGRLRDR